MGIEDFPIITELPSRPATAYENLKIKLGEPMSNYATPVYANTHQIILPIYSHSIKQYTQKMQAHNLNPYATYKIILG